MSSFKDVVGHKNIIQYIENAVKTDKVSHAYYLKWEKVPENDFWQICSL